MKTVGIIAEFNPFHNGHKYLIQQARQVTGANNVIIICSGNFVQRGTPAIMDKSLRAKMALLNGADAVFELPVFYATDSAEGFACSSVRFLDKLNCVDYLCFGCETINLDIFHSIANILSDEPPEYKSLLSSQLKDGISFPKARMNALIEYCQSDIKFRDLITSTQIADILSKPNNILAIEYLKALRKFNSSIKPIPIRRIGAGYHSTDTDLCFASATGIRNQLALKNKSAIDGLIPENCRDEFDFSKTIYMNDFDTILGSKLISADKLDSYYGVTKEIANRIDNLKSSYTDSEHFIRAIYTKNNTYASVSRALLHVMLDFSDQQINTFKSNDYFSYGRLLGFNTQSNVLSLIKENSTLDIIGKFSSFYKESTDLTRQMLDLSINADNLYRMVYMNKYNEYIPTEFERQIVRYISCYLN